MNNVKAYWIGARDIQNNIPVAFRKDFEIPEKCKSAYLNVTGTSRLVFFVNGICVCRGALRSHAPYKEYDTVDITKHLKKGKNSFAVVTLYSPSYPNCTKDSFIAWADINLELHKLNIVTDSSWVFTVADWYGMSPNLLISKGTEMQEHYNLTKEPKDWKIAEYPLSYNCDTIYTPKMWFKNYHCGEYKSVAVFGPIGTPPFVKLLPREISKHVESDYKPYCVWQGTDSKRQEDISLNLATSFKKSKKKGKQVYIKSNSYNNNQYNLFVFDFLKTRTVLPGINIKSFSGNGRIEFYYSIKLEDAPCVDTGFGTPSEGFVDSITPTANITSWQALTSKGFRFLTVRICGDCKVEFIPDCKLIEYPFNSSEKPEIQNSILSKAWDIAEETIRSSTTDYYVDTCWRENALWTYDACVIGKAAFETFSEAAMWKRSMVDIARAISPEGIPLTLAVPGDYTLFDQNLIWVDYCLQYYTYTQDLDFVKEVFPSICRMLDYCDEWVTEENLYIPPMFSWHYIDWAKIDKRPYSLPVNALYIIANTAAEKLAKILENQEYSEIFKARAERIRLASVKFFDDNKQAFICHVEPKLALDEYNCFSFKEFSNDEAFKYNIYANCLSIRAKIGTDKMRTAAADFVAERLNHINPFSDFGAGAYDLLLTPLIAYNKKEHIINYLVETLSKPVLSKFPTFAETRTDGIYNSAHGWGASVISLIKTLLE